MKSELIIGSNQSPIKQKLDTRIYNVSRKKVFKLNVKFRESWKNSSLNLLIYKALSIKGMFTLNKQHKSIEGKTLNNIRCNIKMRYLDKAQIQIRVNKETRIMKTTNQLKKLYLQIYKEEIKDNFQKIYLKKKKEITNEEITKQIYKKDRVDKIECEEDLIFLKSGQGSGKTYQVSKNIATNIKLGKKGIIISDRISLGTTIYHDMDKALKEVGVEDKMMFYKKIDRNLLSSGCNIIISPESLLKLMDEGMSIPKYDNVWIDEAKKVMNNYGTSKTLNNCRKTSLDMLSNLVRRAEQVYCTDADLNDDVIEWMHRIRQPIRCKSVLIWNKKKTDKTETFIYENYERMRLRELKLLEEGKKVYSGHTSVDEAKRFAHKYKKMGYKVLLITGESIESNIDDKITKLTALEKCDEVWLNYDVVITTPCIVYGTSFNVPYFYETFYYYQGTLTGDLTNQSIHRARNLLNNRINVFCEYKLNRNLIRSEEEYERIMNGDIRLLKRLNVDESVRENILSSLDCG
tara:strand:+ start:377 stop:1930 length:1554 start_codon:yes stop_codon:yes gene_type:complete